MAEEPTPVTASTPDRPAGVVDEPTADHASKFGEPGEPINRLGPLYLGVVGAIGVLIAWNLFKLIGHLSGVLTLLLVAAFIAIGLDPLVRALVRRGMSRGIAVAVVFSCLMLVIAGFLAAVVPAVVSQASQLSQQLPDQVDKLLNTKWVVKLDADYGVISKLSNELKAKVSSGQTVAQLFGGVLGAGKAVITGLLSVFEVLILTLYFMSSLNTITAAGYRLLPASRRTRVRALGDEIIRRIGGYLAGQVAVASINGVCTFILLSILGLPYSIVLSITVAILGIIPLVGATIGAVLVALVGLFQSWQIAVIIAIYYVIYQQVENYLIAPRIMSRTVSVPGVVALVAALAGAALLGVLGALIAIPIAAALLLIIQEVLIPRQDRS